MKISETSLIILKKIYDATIKADDIFSWQILNREDISEELNIGCSIVGLCLSYLSQKGYVSIKSENCINNVKITAYGIDYIESQS